MLGSSSHIPYLRDSKPLTIDRLVQPRGYKVSAFTYFLFIKNVREVQKTSLCEVGHQTQPIAKFKPHKRISGSWWDLKKNQFQRSGARDLLPGSSKVEDTADDALENRVYITWRGGRTRSDEGG